MLKIQEFIRQFEDIEDANMFLKEKLHLKIKKSLLRHQDNSYDEVFIYNYDTIKSNKTNVIVKEARALILDKQSNIVSMSFQRFFNQEELTIDYIDWESAVAEERLDGSLIVIYNYNGDWYIQSRSEPMAGGFVHKTDFTYDTLAKRALLSKKKEKDPFWIFKQEENKYCYVFELVSPYNRIVTPYESTSLFLLTIVDKHAEKELSRDMINDFAKKYNLERPETYRVRNIKEVEYLLENLLPLDKGFIVVDDNKNRIKVKNKDYLSISRVVIKSRNLLARCFAEIVLNGNADEITTYFPEYTQVLRLFTDLLSILSDELSFIWFDCQDIKSQKEFAIKIKDNPLSSILFKKRNGYISSIDDELMKIKPDKLVSIAQNRIGSELQNELESLLRGSYDK